MSRLIKDLVPEAQRAYEKWSQECRKLDLEWILTCTYRSQEEQNILFDQGRTKPGKIVTKVKKSKHTLGIAWDIAVLKNGKISWDTKDYVPFGKVALALGGIRWGGDFNQDGVIYNEKFIDAPHFELIV